MTERLLVLSQPSPNDATVKRGSLRTVVLRAQKVLILIALSFLVIPLLAPAFDAEKVYAGSAASGFSERVNEPQSIAVGTVLLSDDTRDDYSADKRVVITTRLATSTSADVLAAQDYAWRVLQAKGWGEGEFTCLINLWHRESGWRYDAQNRSSGAYGIPQALPGTKMASAGSDWMTNYETQINWGMGYVQGRYGTPCGAWNFFLTKGWY